MSEGQGIERSGAPSPGGQSEGWVRAEEQIQYQWPGIYLEKRFLILSQMLPSVRLTLSEKLGQEEMGREGEKEAQNQHKNRNIKVSFSRQTSRDGGMGQKRNKTKQNKKEENKPGKCDGVKRGRGKGRPRQASQRRCPGYSSGTKVTCLLVCTGNGENRDLGLLPTLPDGSFSQPQPQPLPGGPATLSPPRDPVPNPPHPWGLLGPLQSQPLYSRDPGGPLMLKFQESSGIDTKQKTAVL